MATTGSANTPLSVQAMARPSPSIVGVGSAPRARMKCPAAAL